MSSNEIDPVKVQTQVNAEVEWSLSKILFFLL